MVNYVLNHIRGRKGFRHYEYDTLKEEIERFAYETPLLSAYELTKWKNECHLNVSIHAFDAMYKKFFTHVRSQRGITPVYIVHYCHLFSITDERLIIMVTVSNQEVCKVLLKHA